MKSEPECRYDLKDRVAIVTGAAGAIGTGICRGLLRSNCRVAATDISRDRLNNLVKEFHNEFGDRIKGIEIDVTDYDSVSRGIKKLLRFSVAST